MSVVEADPSRLLRELPHPVWIPAPAGHAVPVWRFGLGGSRRPLVLVHGLQSRSGWFVRAARRAASLGHPVYAFDRCRSGVGPEAGDPGPELAGLVEEIDVVTEHALAGRTHAS